MLNLNITYYNWSEYWYLLELIIQSIILTVMHFVNSKNSPAQYMQADSCWKDIDQIIHRRIEYHLSLNHTSWKTVQMWYRSNRGISNVVCFLATDHPCQTMSFSCAVAVNTSALWSRSLSHWVAIAPTMCASLRLVRCHIFLNNC